jgi:ketosteroid isomerase-like protein
MASVSLENLERLRRLYAAYNEKDVEAFIAGCDPAIRFESAFAAVGGEVYRGPAGVRAFFDDMTDAWGDEVRAEPEAYFDLGDRILAFHTLRGEGKNSGASVVMPVALIVQWREDRVVYLKAFASRQDALTELGVSEGELRPIA